MQVTRWLAVYRDDDGNTRAAMIQPREVGDFPFGIDEDALGLAEFNRGGGLTLVEMPHDAHFRPMIVDAANDSEGSLQFIDL